MSTSNSTKMGTFHDTDADVTYRNLDYFFYISVNLELFTLMTSKSY